MKLDVKALSLSMGVTFGVGVLILGLTAMTGWGVGVVEMISSLYVGYAPTLLGSIIGGLYGFVDGAVGGAIIAWLYNRFAK